MFFSDRHVLFIVSIVHYLKWFKIICQFEIFINILEKAKMLNKIKCCPFLKIRFVRINFEQNKEPPSMRYAFHVK